MHLTEHFKSYIKKNNLFTPADLMLVAVSGGVDSVVLCELCKQAGYPFMVAHCNFGLRGEESVRDEAFVSDLALQYGVPLLVRHFDTAAYAKQNKVSIQVAARVLRYAWFNELVMKTPAAKLPAGTGLAAPVAGPEPAYILTAHHADDNMETMLMNFFKGTGITGMRGMLPKQGRLVRPLLFVRKAALYRFATDNNLVFVEDASNAEDKYTRNYFRNQLIPAVQKVFPAMEENLQHNLHRFQEAELLYQQAVAVHKKKLLELKGNEVHIPVLKLKKCIPLETVTYEIIKTFGYSGHQVKDVLNLLDAESGKMVRSGTHRIIKNRNWLIIAPAETTSSPTIIIEDATQAYRFENGYLHIRQMPVAHYHSTADACTAQVDASHVTFPLILRKQKAGDYFYPLGMRKKKKVSRFLSGLKLSVPEKENTWVLEANKKIIWVIGKRIDDRFRITGSTGMVYQVTFTPNDPGLC